MCNHQREKWIHISSIRTNRCGSVIFSRTLRGWIGRLCFLNRLLMNRYLDVVYETFCLEIHSEVINRLNVIRFESSNIKRDKSEKLITISVGFKQNRQSNKNDDDDMFYTLELLK